MAVESTYFHGSQRKNVSGRSAFTSSSNYETGNGRVSSDNGKCKIATQGSGEFFFRISMVNSVTSIHDEKKQHLASALEY